ncbi:L,D-transpeptidase [Kitasatospora sp. NBC_01302]|uniref:L,D-transpeptidase n=1 Tax=Kitasatospora sp. NBC_01302 TaxID=2903575 RepID=UPI002E15E9E7|nr:Ig-like domain-containing protein [Kitasatospora sp. NBC_01302]
MKAIRIGLAVGSVLLLVTACDGGSHAAGAGSSDRAAAPGSPPASPSAPAAPPSPKTSAAVLDVEPKDGAQGVAPDALKIAVANGKLTQVAVTDKDGKAVAGTMAADGTNWVPAAGLSVSSQYRVSARAVDAQGVVAGADSTFTTLTPARTSRSGDNIDTGRTYGVGMIIKVDFQRAVTNKAAVANGITVEASDGTQVKGHWFDDDNWLELRPEDFWKPGTTVKVHVRLSNVEVAPGVYGGRDRDEQFTIGRSQISTVDAAAHTMDVQRDGQELRRIPITAGSDDHASWNGTMVISAKEGTVEMNSATVPGLKAGDYDLVVPHSMRLTDSGTYVHGNYWSAGAYGHSNNSHGCVGLEDVKGGSDTSVAGTFYADSLVGDVVKVVNSKGGQVAPDNGLSGWNMPWSTW